MVGVKEIHTRLGLDKLTALIQQHLLDSKRDVCSTKNLTTLLFARTLLFALFACTKEL